MGARAVAIVLVCAGCGRVGFDPLGGATGDAATGDGAPGGDAAPLCTSFGPWSAPTPIAELDSMGNSLSPDATSDDLVVFFHSDNGTGQSSIYRADRASRAQPFGNITEFVAKDTSQYTDAALAAHGTRLYYSKNAMTAMAEAAVVNITGTAHDAPVLIPELGTQAFGLWVRDDELEAWVSVPGLIHRYRRATTAASWAPAADGDLTELGDAGYPTFSADLLTVYFESGRSGLTQLWTATRPSYDQPFGAPTALTALNDPTMATGDPSLSADGLTIRFDVQKPSGFAILQSTRACL